MTKGSKRNPLPEPIAVAALCDKLSVSPVDSVDALTDLLVHDWRDLPGFRDKALFAVGTSTTLYRTGQTSLTYAANGIAYGIKSLREWYTA